MHAQFPPPSHPLLRQPHPTASSNQASLCIQQTSLLTSVSTAKQHRQRTEAIMNTVRGCIVKKGCGVHYSPSLLLTGFEVHQTHPMTTGGHILSKLGGDTYPLHKRRI